VSGGKGVKTAAQKFRQEGALANSKGCDLIKSESVSGRQGLKEGKEGDSRLTEERCLTKNITGLFALVFGVHSKQKKRGRKSMKKYTRRLSSVSPKKDRFSARNRSKGKQARLGKKKRATRSSEKLIVSFQERGREREVTLKKLYFSRLGGGFGWGGGGGGGGAGEKRALGEDLFRTRYLRELKGRVLSVKSNVGSSINFQCLRLVRRGF